MLKNEQKVTIEWIKGQNNLGHDEVISKSSMTNPINEQYSNNDKLALMVSRILHEEFPKLKHNSLLYDLVMYSIMEKMKTIQSMENVLSYIKESNAKSVQDVSFKNGEVCIKCSI